MSSEISQSFCDSIVKKYDRKNPARPVYVIQEHHAKRLHWDLRFEISGIDYEKFSKLYKNKFRDKMYLTKLKKKIAVRINVPMLTADMITNITPEKHREEIVIALQAAGKLLNWYLEFYQK